jgi:pyruvate dehydrogenase E2 component (dihydrolipoamide acetyltransferase)
MDVKLPNLGEGADSGTVVNIFVKEGDAVTKDQSLIELETGKAVASIPSTAAGTVAKLHVKQGDKLTVGGLIVTLSGVAGAPAADEPAKPAASAAKPAAAPTAPAAEPPSAEVEISADELGVDVSEANAAVPASPSLRKFANELGLNLSRIPGSGLGGRVTTGDVRSYIQKLVKRAAAPKAAAGAAPARPSPERIDFTKWGEVTKKPLTSLRKVIAQRMGQSWSAVPRVSQFDDVDLTVISALREKYKDAYAKKGAKLTPTAFILKAVAATLKKHPIFNSSLDETAQEIVLKEYVHLGLAVDTDAGLIVPVIRNVDKKSLLQISLDIAELAEKTRARKVSPEELQGGTFTISNQGAIGGAHFTPIVNLPEVAILGIGRSAPKPVARDGQVVVRTLMPIVLSYDHRVIDGGSAARFTVDLVKAFEEFSEEAVKI